MVKATLQSNRAHPIIALPETPLYVVLTWNGPNEFGIAGNAGEHVAKIEAFLSTARLRMVADEEIEDVPISNRSALLSALTAALFIETGFEPVEIEDSEAETPPAEVDPDAVGSPMGGDDDEPPSESIAATREMPT